MNSDELLWYLLNLLIVVATFLPPFNVYLLFCNLAHESSKKTPDNGHRY